MTRCNKIFGYLHMVVRLVNGVMTPSINCLFLWNEDIKQWNFQQQLQRINAYSADGWGRLPCSTCTLQTKIHYKSSKDWNRGALKSTDNSQLIRSWLGTCSLLWSLYHYRLRILFFSQCHPIELNPLFVNDTPGAQVW